jgi:endo-1,4-beta-D-glucanase Y
VRRAAWIAGLGSLVIVVGLLASMVPGCRQPSPSNRSREFLRESWDAYKRLYIPTEGNVVDPDRGGGETTSEGQGYAMLRAAWMHDEKSFVETFDWTEQHLRRPDGLYSWLWTPAGGGKVADANTASDADQEIALALVIGSRVFGDRKLLDRGRQLLRAIREHERVDMRGGWFPAAGNWATAERIVNLSYFVPYAYPYFARVDPEGRWDSVIETGYTLIINTINRPERPGARLIPDFMTVTGDGIPAPLPEASGLSRDFSSDAMRIYWRVALDCRLHKRGRACADPLGVGQLTTMLARDGALFTKYSVDGMPLERTESASFYGAALPFLMLYAPATADAVRTKYLSGPALNSILTARNRYFDANWMWFGLAAADGLIETNTPAVNVVQTN